MINQLEKLEAAKAAYLWLPFLTLPGHILHLRTNKLTNDHYDLLGCFRIQKFNKKIDDILHPEKYCIGDPFNSFFH